MILILEVQEIIDDYIITLKGLVDKTKFYIQKKSSRQY